MTESVLQDVWYCIGEQVQYKVCGAPRERVREPTVMRKWKWQGEMTARKLHSKRPLFQLL